MIVDEYFQELITQNQFNVVMFFIQKKKDNSEGKFN